MKSVVQIRKFESVFYKFMYLNEKCQNLMDQQSV